MVMRGCMHGGVNPGCESFCHYNNCYFSFGGASPAIAGPTSMFTVELHEAAACVYSPDCLQQNRCEV